MIESTTTASQVDRDMADMHDDWDVSVALCTYNRCGMLAEALERLLCQQADGIRYETIVVDNNSTDETRAVVESFCRRGHLNLRYLFEDRQGLSYARNKAISAARSAIIAFTDDDVRVAPDWIATIKQAFDAHSEVDCVGGKVLPFWTTAPPRWLTVEHWAPLATVDYGDRSFYVNAHNRLCLLTANMAIRRPALDVIGGFQPELQRVGDSLGSMEDHELLIRFWRANRQGMYVPELRVVAEIATDRLSKDYHRRWHAGHGKFCAMARLEELEQSETGQLFGVSAHMYRQAASDAVAWCGDMARGRRSRAFLHETRLRFFAGFFRRRYQDFCEVADVGRVREIARFARSLARRRRRRPPAQPGFRGAPSRSPRQ